MTGSTSILRSRLPTAAKIALLVTGTIPDVPVSPRKVSPPHARCRLCAGKISLVVLLGKAAQCRLWVGRLHSRTFSTELPLRVRARHRGAWVVTVEGRHPQLPAITCSSAVAGAVAAIALARRLGERGAGRPSERPAVLISCSRCRPGAKQCKRSQLARTRSANALSPLCATLSLQYIQRFRAKKPREQGLAENVAIWMNGWY